MWRILIVDDEELIRNAMSSYIEQTFDAELYRAASGYEALSLLHRMRFDIVISDISMPMMDGVELLRSIKQIWPMCYVIMLTVYDQFDYVYKTLKYERVDYVLKAEGYVGVHNALQKAFDVLERAREQEKQLLAMGEHIEQMKPQVRSLVVTRLLRGQTALPPAEELDAMDFGLDTGRPVVFAVGLIEGGRDAQSTMLLSDFSYSVMARLGGKRAELRHFLVGSYAVWLLQRRPEEETEDQALLAYVRDAFEQTSENLLSLRGVHTAVAMLDELCAWDALPDAFARATTLLEGTRGQSGLLLFSAAQGETEPPAPAGLAIEDLNMLWEYLQTGRKAEFSTLLAQKLRPMARLRDVTAAAPLALVCAVDYLYLQACGTLQPPAEVSDYARSVLNAANHVSGEEWAAAALGLFETIFDCKSESAANSMNTMINQVNEYVREHFREDIHLSTIAEAFHYSPSYLSRLYREMTNETLSAYIISVRLSHAKHLLRHTSLAIREVAHESGFYSVKYFTQAFKKNNADLTPGQYRAQAETAQQER